MTYSSIPGMILILGLSYLAFWQKHIIIYFITGLITIYVALSWVDIHLGISIAMLFLGLLFLWEGLMVALEDGGPARGWEQIKGWFSRRRGRG